MRQIKFVCKQCGKEKPVKQYGRFKQVNKLFCDVKCYGAWRRTLKGKLAPNYKDGSCNERQLLRASLEYKQWRTAVFQRDNYTCVICGNPSKGNIEADHIKSFALYPELRFEVSNGRTLCEDCHKLTDNYGYKKGFSYA